MRTSLAALAAGVAVVMMGPGRASADIASPSTAFVTGNFGTSTLGPLGSPEGRRLSSTSVVSSSAMSATGRYAYGMSSDPSPNDLTVSGLSAWSMSFNVTDAGPWTVLVNHSRVGAVTTDPASSFDDLSATLFPVSASVSGATLAAGSLTLPSFVYGPSDATVDLLISQSGSAVLTGTGPSLVTLTFSWSTTVRAEASLLAPGGIALRMGEDSSFTGSTIGAYPGVGGRTQALDGHFVTVTIPAPGVATCGVIGFGAMLTRRRR